MPCLLSPLVVLVHAHCRHKVDSALCVPDTIHGVRFDRRGAASAGPATEGPAKQLSGRSRNSIPHQKRRLRLHLSGRYGRLSLLASVALIMSRARAATFAPSLASQHAVPDANALSFVAPRFVLSLTQGLLSCDLLAPPILMPILPPQPTSVHHHIDLAHTLPFSKEQAAASPSTPPSLSESSPVPQSSKSSTSSTSSSPEAPRCH